MLVVGVAKIFSMKLMLRSCSRVEDVLNIDMDVMRGAYTIGFHGRMPRANKVMHLEETASGARGRVLEPIRKRISESSRRATYVLLI